MDMNTKYENEDDAKALKYVIEATLGRLEFWQGLLLETSQSDPADFGYGLFGDHWREVRPWAKMADHISIHASIRNHAIAIHKSMIKRMRQEIKICLKELEIHRADLLAITVMVTETKTP